MAKLVRDSEEEGLVEDSPADKLLQSVEALQAKS